MRDFFPRAKMTLSWTTLQLEQVQPPTKEKKR